MSSNPIAVELKSELEKFSPDLNEFADADGCMLSFRIANIIYEMVFFNDSLVLQMKDGSTLFSLFEYSIPVHHFKKVNSPQQVTELLFVDSENLTSLVLVFNEDYLTILPIHRRDSHIYSK